MPAAAVIPAPIGTQGHGALRGCLRVLRWRAAVWWRGVRPRSIGLSLRARLGRLCLLGVAGPRVLGLQIPWNLQSAPGTEIEIEIELEIEMSNPPGALLIALGHAGRRAAGSPEEPGAPAAAGEAAGEGEGNNYYTLIMIFIIIMMIILL